MYADDRWLFYQCDHRIREELKFKGDSGDLKELVNRCITQTLTRSIYTSLTTFIMVAVLYVMGVSSIKEFALPLMVGIVCGAYSSVCITGALWYVMKTRGAAQKTVVNVAGGKALTAEKAVSADDETSVSEMQGSQNTSGGGRTNKKKTSGKKKRKRRQ